MQSAVPRSVALRGPRAVDGRSSVLDGVVEIAERAEKGGLLGRLTVYSTTLLDLTISSRIQKVSGCGWDRQMKIFLRWTIKMLSVKIFQGLRKHNIDQKLVD